MGKFDKGKERKVEVIITKSVKWDKRWLYPTKKTDDPLVVTVPYKIALQIVGTGAGSFCNPNDEKGETPNLENYSIDTSLDEVSLIRVLCEIEGVDEDIAKSLIANGFVSIDIIATSSIDDIFSVQGISEKLAATILRGATALKETN